MNQSTSDDESIQPQPSSLDLTRSRPGPVPVLRYGSPVESDALKHGPRMYVAVVREPAKLIDYVPDWEHLAQHAIEPNLFYEHWFLLPAIEAFGSGVDLRIVFIFSSNPERPTGPPILSGMFPLEHSGSYLGLPASTLSFWKHPQCFLCTPLIRRAQAKETLQAFFAYLASEAAGCSLLELNFIPAEGPLYQVLTGLLHERTVSFFVFECFTRAVLQRAADAATYLDATISGRHRKELRRKEKRLSELGCLEYTTLDSDLDVDRWIESFLSLEASGWKGKDGGALKIKEVERTFFQTVSREAYRRGRLMMLGVNLEGQPVAQKCNFLAGDGAFAFKIGYDERYSDFSPGMLLEIENIRRVHDSQTVLWMDSCAAPDHFMINRLWTERRAIQTIVIPTRKGWPEFLVSLMPLLRWLKRKLRVGDIAGTGKWSVDRPSSNSPSK